MNLKDYVFNEINKEKLRLRRLEIKNISKIIKENIEVLFNSDDLYYFPCAGSGYYLKYRSVSGYNLKFYICNKQGVRKGNDIFTLCWFDYDNLIKIEK